jgi:thiamine pyrophosphate-dependent acetolactate synthase large subunit-like protein
MTIDVATGIVRILKQEGVGWVSTFPVCRVNNALGREGVPMLMMRDDRYAVAVADAFSRITAGSRIGVCTFQGGVNAAGMQYAYAGMAQAYEDGSPVLCITDGVQQPVRCRIGHEDRVEVVRLSRHARAHA